MAGDVVDALLRLACPEGHSHEAGVQGVLVADRSGHKAGGLGVKNRAPQQIPEGVAEKGEARHFGGIALHRQLRVGPDGRRIHVPAFGVENSLGVPGADGADDFVHRDNVQKAH